jgi:hypothetical protein
VRSVSAGSGALRVARGVTLACCCAVLAITAHALGGGSARPTWLVVALTGGVAAAGVALAGRQRGPLALLFVVGATQAVMHLVLDAASAASAASQAPDALHAAGHAHAAAVQLSPLAMATMHALATLVMAVLLACTDHAVFAVAAVLRWLLRLVLRAGALLPQPMPHAHRRTPPVHPAAGERIVDIALRRLCARRAPPLVPH